MALDFGLDPNDPRNRDRFAGFTPTQVASAEPPPPRPPANIPPATSQEQSSAGIRRQPLQPQLIDTLNYAAQNNGVRAHVYSGGQPAKGQGWPRTGSTRHDLGGAADLTLTDVKDGHTLDMTNPQDQARMAGFVRDAVSAGATGVGAHPDYMGPNGIHVGGGVAAAWGARNSSANAPPWLTAAWQDGMKNRMTPEQVKTALKAKDISSPEGSASASAPPDATVQPTKVSTAPTTAGPSTGEVAAAATKPFFRTESPNYPSATTPGYGLPPQLPVTNAPGTSVPFPMRRPATAPTAVPQAAPGPTPVQTASQPQATNDARKAAPPPAPPGARNAGASPTAVPKAAPGPTPVATAAQPAATGAVRAAAGGPTLGEAIIKSMGPRGAGMSTYVDPGTGHQVINPGGSGEQAMGITRDIGPVRQTVSRLAPAAPQRPVAPQPPGAGTTTAPAAQPVPPPKPDFAGPNAPFPFTGSVPNAPGQPPPGSFASRFPGDRFNFMGPTPPAPDAAGVLAAPTVNQPQQPLPPQPQPYPSVTEQLPPGFNVFAGSPQPAPTSISQLPWWPFLDGGGGGNALAYSGDWGSGY
jgi:hypothetical protein